MDIVDTVDWSMHVALAIIVREQQGPTSFTTEHTPNNNENNPLHVRIPVVSPGR